MRLDSIEDLKGCARDNIPCKFLIGLLSFNPLRVSCTIGNECGRGYCSYHLDNDNGMTVDQIIEEENKCFKS